MFKDDFTVVGSVLDKLSLGVNVPEVFVSLSVKARYGNIL